MEGCSGMSPWTNIYRQAGLETPRPISSILMDPIQQAPQEKGELISWCDAVQNDVIMSPLIGLNNNNNTIRSDPFDATSSSIEHSLECLLSGTNSNTEVTSSDNYDEDNYNNNNNNSNNNNNNNNSSEKFWNFSSNNNDNNNIQNNVLSPKKISNTISTTVPKCNKRQRSYNTTSITKKSNNSNNDNNNYLSNNISFQRGNANSSASSMDEADAEAIQQMKEMIYRAAAFRPVDFGVDHQIDRPKRRNVRISNDPQTAAARQRRERISERLRVLQKLVPGGSKMDTASMLDEAANYLKFLRNQVKDLENFGNKFHQFHPNHHGVISGINLGVNHPSNNLNFSPMVFPMQTRPS